MGLGFSYKSVKFSYNHFRIENNTPLFISKFSGLAIHKLFLFPFEAFSHLREAAACLAFRIKVWNSATTIFA